MKAHASQTNMPSRNLVRFRITITTPKGQRSAVLDRPRIGLEKNKITLGQIWRGIKAAGLVLCLMLSLSAFAAPANTLAKTGITLDFTDPASNYISHYVVYQWVSNSSPMRWSCKTSYTQQVIMEPLTNVGTLGFKAFAVGKDGTRSGPSTNLWLVRTNATSAPGAPSIARPDNSTLK
jgi:hypothetical protein